MFDGLAGPFCAGLCTRCKVRNAAGFSQENTGK